MAEAGPEHTQQGKQDSSGSAEALQMALQIDPSRLAELVGQLTPDQRTALLRALGAKVVGEKQPRKEK